MWRSEHSGRRAIIGALIGFGLGAAIGARGNGSVRASMAFGAIGAGIGGAFGSGVPPPMARSPYWQGRWEGDK